MTYFLISGLGGGAKWSGHNDRLILTSLHFALRGILKAHTQDVSERTLQSYSKCYSVASVMRTFTLRGFFFNSFISNQNYSDSIS
jgi:hypothetical protein